MQLRSLKIHKTSFKINFWKHQKTKLKKNARQIISNLLSQPHIAREGKRQCNLAGTNASVHRILVLIRWARKHQVHRKFQISFTQNSSVMITMWFG